MKRGAILFGLLSVLACDDGSSAGGTGTVRVAISGEEASREGFPVGSGDDEIAFADGWSVEFTKVLVALDAFELRTADGAVASLTVDPVVADVHRGEPELWTFENVPARRWDRVGFHYAPPPSNARAANNVSDEDIERMADEGLSLLVQAVARKDELEVELEYGFAFTVAHTRCVNGLDDTDGIVVPTNAVVDAQVTVHLDHLFFDSYASEDAELRFDAMAAVAPASGPLTLEDLAAQTNLSDLLDADGEPLELAYESGSAFSPVPRDLREYVIAAATTTGHFNGEGHCDYEQE